MNACPCCTGRKPVGARAWTHLCESCGERAFRLQRCECEDVRPLVAPELTKALRVVAA